MFFSTVKNNLKRPASGNDFEDAAECRVCKLKKPIVWDCAWDKNHGVCESCAAHCSRCNRAYCDQCRVVLVFCDSCDAVFCPTCKPRVCVCIVPRMATCFMINFKTNNNEFPDTTPHPNCAADGNVELGAVSESDTEPAAKKSKRQSSESTTTTNASSTTTDTVGAASDTYVIR